MTWGTRWAFPSAKFSAQLGSGGTFEGFRYATVEEVLELFIHGGLEERFIDGENHGDIGFRSAVSSLLGLLDATRYSGAQCYLNGTTVMFWALNARPYT